MPEGGFAFCALVIALMIMLLSFHPAFAKAAKPQKSFSILRITEISVRGSKLRIRGETDLPKGSFLHLRLNEGMELLDEKKAVKA